MPVTVKLAWDKDADPRGDLPHYASLGAAGADLRANFSEPDRAQGLILAPSEWRLIPTGLLVEIPEGYEMQIRPRSGLALKHGVSLLNAPGTIDADYRGEVGVILINLGEDPFVIERGDRIAQMVIAPVTRGVWAEVDHLDETERGEGGFGSTGVTAG